MQRRSLPLLVASLLVGLHGLICKVQRLRVFLLVHLRLHHGVQNNALHLNIVCSLAQVACVLPDLHELLNVARLEVRFYDKEHALGLPPLVARLAVHLHQLLRCVERLFSVERLDVRVVLQLERLLRALAVFQVQVKVPGHHADLLGPLEVACVDTDVRQAGKHVSLAPLVICLPEELNDLPGRVHGLLPVLQDLGLVFLLHLRRSLLEVCALPRVPGLANQCRFGEVRVHDSDHRARLALLVTLHAEECGRLHRCLLGTFWPVLRDLDAR
mmetsp:Transcript_119732/g.334202  ORF Transcript_119732/g.334202 Transcript_119732/m.334202 type:complete len:271 (-) Transcript_119732:293-1105(-)